MNIPSVEELEQVRDLLEEIKALLEEVNIPSVAELEAVAASLDEIKKLQED